MKDEEIRYAMQQDENLLKIQNVELRKQINKLETDRLNMMKPLKHNAAQIGESGIIFMGLLADNIIKVT